MRNTAKVKNSRNPFMYSEILDDYLKEKSNIETDIKNRKKIEGKDPTPTQEDAIRANDGRKVRTLNNQIFRAMGNLIHFFEYVNAHEELNGIFDDDVEELLGFKGPHAKRHRVDDPKYLVFFRLMDAIYNYTSKNKGENVRLQIVRALTESVSQMILDLTSKRDRRLATKIIWQDLARLEFWGEYCTAGIQINTKEPHRKIGF